MKTPRDIILKMYTNAANLKHIAETGTINGSLLIDIEKAILEYHNQFGQNPTPTEAEINEAAQDGMISNNLPYEQADDYIRGFKGAIQWLQNYQTQGREKPIESDAKPIPLWYDELSLIGHLRSLGWSMASAKEIASTYADNLQQAFAKGWEKAYNDYKKSGTMEYVYYPKQLAEINQLNASQPNPAIAVIEAEITKSKTDIHYLTGEIKFTSQTKINLLETILKQIKQ